MDLCGVFMISPYIQSWPPDFTLKLPSDLDKVKIQLVCFYAQIKHPFKSCFGMEPKLVEVLIIVLYCSTSVSIASMIPFPLGFTEGYVVIQKQLT